MSDEPLTEAAVKPYLRGRLGAPFSWFESCPSTQDVLRGAGLPEGAVAVAEHQTAGRGRAGRAWEDGPSRGVLASVLLRPGAAGDIAQLSLVVGLAVAQAVEAVAGCRAMLKWPNDVIVTDRKVAGILLEAGTAEVVCGIGVNVNQLEGELPTQTKIPAGSLALATGAPHDRARLLGELLTTLELRYDDWRAAGLAPLLPELAGRNWLRGKAVATGDGNGIAGEIGADGRLLIELPDGTTRAIGSAEVIPLPSG